MQGVSPTAVAEPGAGSAHAWVLSPYCCGLNREAKTLGESPSTHLAESVLEWDTKHDDQAPVVPIKVKTLCYPPPCPHSSEDWDGKRHKQSKQGWSKNLRGPMSVDRRYCQLLAATEASIAERSCFSPREHAWHRPRTWRCDERDGPGAAVSRPCGSCPGQGGLHDCPASR